MKKILLILGGLVISLVVTTGVIGFNIYQSGKALAISIISGTPESVSQSTNRLLWWWQPVHLISQTLPVLDLKAIDELLVNMPTLIGLHQDRHYIVLFQNNTELRPTGGFMGSYGELWFKKGKLTDFTIQDIFVPDGQIKGYVKEPESLSKYLFNEGTPGWRLRDANWHPDFPTATKAIGWFFKEGGIEPSHGYIAVTLQPAIEILRQIGSITLTDYHLTLTPDNFYQVTQTQVQTDFFPGSTKKGDYLRSIGTTIMDYLISHPQQLPQLIKPFMTSLYEKQLFISIPDSLTTAWHQIGWDGSLRSVESDYLMINEANLGSSKANCCIERKLTDIVTTSATQIDHTIQLDYANHNASPSANLHQWGGDYKNYVRIIVPETAKLHAIAINDAPLDINEVEVETIVNKTSFGFFVNVPIGQHRLIAITYSVTPSTSPYQYFFQKQSGIESWPVSITINQGYKKTVHTGNLRTDTILR